MKVVVACGGTGGHSFPGLAAAEELRARGHEVVIWASGRAVEASVMRGWNGPVFWTGAKQLAPKNAFAIIESYFRCRRELKRQRPDALLAMGSYASLPPVLAARRFGIKVYLHEANTIPGKAVEFLSHFATAVAISFETTVRFLPNTRTVLTGLPVRASITAGQRFDFIPPNAFVVFVTGGSQGAHAVNELMSAALVMFKHCLDRRNAVPRPLYIIHQTGEQDEARVIAAYAKASIPARVHAFENEMANAFASADIVVARAGASTCFELAACGKSALLIPLPTALRNHQHLNADAFVSKGAADEGKQAELTARQLSRYLLSRYDNPDLLASRRAKIKALATPDAAARLADLVEDK